MTLKQNEIPTIASWWVGWRMSWIEQLCLRSFVEQGHKVILYTHGEVDNVPEGVEQRSDKEIWNPGKVIIYQGSLPIAAVGSPSLHSDLFRYQLLNKTDYIWIDADVYCHQRFPDQPWMFAKTEHINNFTINGAVLRLPRHSKTLQLLIETFVSGDEYPIVPWKSKRNQFRQRLRKKLGFGTHISKLPWPTPGPIALTKFLQMTGEVKHALPTHTLYPLPIPKYGRWKLMFGTQEDIKKYLPHDCLSVHLYTGILNKKIFGKKFISTPPQENWLVARAKELGIDPAQAPQRIKEKPA